jgi:uncharacterized protein YutE (UPF0331/DUF86 family)
VVDEPRVIGLLRRVTADVAVLRQRTQDGGDALLEDRDRLDATKYTLVTALEGCIRVAQHVAAAEGWEPPATNAQAFRVLADNGVIDVELGGRLARAAGFRNLLIHQYADIDDKRVIGNLDSLGDLDAFVDGVLAWVDAQDQEPSAGATD